MKKYSDSVLFAMAVYSTEENKKDECLKRTLASLQHTVDFSRHKLYLSVNDYTEETKKILDNHKHMIDEVIYNDNNLGTAKAINKCWALRKENQHCIKMDDDVVIHSRDWVEEMLEALERDNNIGIIGLKRKDCIENVKHSDEYYRSKLIQLPHTPGQTWMTVEEVHHVMGTCQLYNSDLLNKIGYLYQPKLYGWDDVLASARSRAAGFKNVFLSHIPIDHIDEGRTPYQGWKESHAFEDIQLIQSLIDKYKTGEANYYYGI